MTDFRPYHAKCQTRYRCEKNEVAIAYSDHSVLVGDLWQCPECGDRIVRGWAATSWDAYLSNDKERIFAILEAIEQSPEGWVALDAFRAATKEEVKQ